MNYQEKDSFRILARSAAHEQVIQELSAAELNAVSGAGTGTAEAKASSGSPPDREVKVDASWQF